MEINIDSNKREEKKLEALKENASAIFYGSDLIDFILSSADIKITMLAALLSVTERTLNNWKNLEFESKSNPVKFKRLELMYKIVDMFVSKGIRGKKIVFLLNEPIYIENEDLTLRYIINEDEENSLWPFAVDKVVNDYNSIDNNS